METSISVNDLPSKKFNNIWDEGICYSEVNNIITRKKSPEEAYKWIGNFQKNFSNNLEKHKDKINNNTRNKRCRDLYYIIYDILYQLKRLEGYNSIYSGIKENIKGFINSAFMNYSLRDSGYMNCLPASINEADYEYGNGKDKKYIDDLGEDITYIEKNIDQINSSHECSKIKAYLEEEFYTRNRIYQLNNEIYEKILGYYEKNNFDSFKDIIAKIECTTSEDSQQKVHLDDSETRLDFLPSHIIILPILFLLGFLLIFSFLCKLTPFRFGFNRKIWKKLIFSNNADDEVSHKILEHSSEYAQTNSYNDEYKVLYNSVADT
ncbi:PIR protein [Plasmodium ovale]|uniref:PIR Superfamily Protein n=2 Tax=Plasmodium ovale TaxID=36330 RepID=A0A1A8WRB1_PLAOA|nr:PIR Superfamily Protein [Plasmodium ovale curtisi]SBT83661.1 PIR protein [Plasmodium ovale]